MGPQQEKSQTPEPKREKPVEQAPAPAVTAPISDTRREMETTAPASDTFRTTNLLPSNTYDQAAGPGPRQRARETDNTTMKTDDSFGMGGVRTTTSREVIDRVKVKDGRRRKGPSTYRNRNQTTETQQVVTASEGNIKIGQTQHVTGPSKETKTTTNGMVLNSSNWWDSSYTRQSSTTDRDGNTRGGSMSVNRSGVGGTRDWSDANGNSRSIYGSVGNHEVNGGASMGRHNPKTGNGGSISLNGGVVLNRPDLRVAGQNSDGMDAAIADMSGGPAHAMGWTNGVRVGGKLQVQAAVVGGKIEANYATSTSTNFHTTSIDQGELARVNPGLANRGITDPAQLQKTDPRAYKKYMKQTAGRRLTAREGGRGAKNIQELNMDGLKPGEGMSLQASSSFSGGAGLSVYGVGGSVNGSTAQAQRTIVHRNTDGSMSVDIQTANQKSVGADAELGNGAVQAGGGAEWGDASRVRFKFADSDEGRAAMADFQRTGILPGADKMVGVSSRTQQRFHQLSGKQNPTPEEKAELDGMADELNNAMMSRDPEKDLPKMPGVQYEQIEQSKSHKREAHVKAFGYNLLDSSTTNSSSTMGYMGRDGQQHTRYIRGQESNYAWSRSESESMRLDDKGEHGLTVQGVMNDDSSQRLWNRSGQSRPTDSYLFGLIETSPGSQDTMTVNMSEGDVDSWGRNVSPLALNAGTRRFQNELGRTERDLALVRGQQELPVSTHEMAMRHQRNNGLGAQPGLFGANNQFLLNTPGIRGADGPMSVPGMPQLQGLPGSPSFPGFGMTPGTDRRANPFGMPGGMQQFPFNNSQLGIGLPQSQPLSNDQAQQVVGQMTPEQRMMVTRQIRTDQQFREASLQNRMPELQALAITDPKAYNVLPDHMKLRIAREAPADEGLILTMGIQDPRMKYGELNRIMTPIMDPKGVQGAPKLADALYLEAQRRQDMDAYRRAVQMGRK